MKMDAWKERWKYPAILLLGIGVSNLGSWVYFIALNLIILDMTNSPLALSILYIMSPLAGLITNIWAGSLVDRVNKRSLMIVLDFVRAVVICVLPLMQSVWMIFGAVLIIQMASRLFGLGSFVYITKLIPKTLRPRFNSLNSLLGSGAFLLGPAIAGLLFMFGTPLAAIYINGAALFFSGMITFLMPNLEDGKLQKESEAAKFSIHAIKSDFQLVARYYRKHLLVMAVCLTFAGLMVVMASAVDSLEAAFSTMVLGLNEGEYGFLVSIAGAGILIGALCNASIVKRVSLAALISIGSIGNVIGYIIYAFSHSITVAGIGFFVLAFFVSFANTGFATFYQNTIPVENMGRIGGINGFIESVLTIIMTVLFGAMAQYFSIRGVIVGGVLFMLVLAFVLSALIVKTSRTMVQKEHSKLSL